MAKGRSKTQSCYSCSPRHSGWSGPDRQDSSLPHSLCGGHFVGRCIVPCHGDNGGH